MILAVNFIIIFEKAAVDKERKFKQNQAYPQRMLITQINGGEVTSPPSVGNRSFRPGYLDSYFRVIQLRNIRTRPCPKPTTPTPQINPTPNIKRCVKQTSIDDWNNLPNENITSVWEIYLESKTVNLLMCDFISDEIYLKSTKK